MLLLIDGILIIGKFHIYNYIYICIYIYIYNINMTKCQYQQCKRVLNTRVERIKQNKMEIK